MPGTLKIILENKQITTLRNQQRASQRNSFKFVCDEKRADHNTQNTHTHSALAPNKTITENLEISRRNWRDF